MLFITEHNCETGKITQRELTAEEIKQREDEFESRIAEAEAKEAARQAILDRLGLNADEVNLLLG